MTKQIHIIGIAGSLRKGSYNKALLSTAQKICPQGAEIDIADISSIPPYNQDVEEAGLPASVQEFKDKIKRADAILFVTPEYNYSIPGVLKNAIDWGSRPYGNNSFQGKPAGIMSASVSMLGGARAQYHLRQSMVFLDMHPMNMPEFMLPSATEKFDEAGTLTDEKTKERIKNYLKSFIAWIHDHDAGDSQ